MPNRIAVDVGGTFTDLVLSDEETGRIVIGKMPTVPDAPDEGVLAVLNAVLADGDVASSEYFLHGTTVGLNALLENRGALVGLLCTRGFRDVLEVRRGDRGDPYDLFWHPPAPMVERHLRIPVGGRMRADGVEHAPLAPADVTEAAGRFTEHGVGAVAVAFMNAYANPAHELEAERLLREAGFTGDVSLSHRVSGEYREYERTCTTVIDAFVRRRLGSYLGRVEDALGDKGFAGGCMIMRSGGGAMTFDEAADRPFETILSGPVAGARAVAELARALDLRHAISADVGGTSFDTCLIDDGRPPVLYQGEVVGLPIQTPWIDVRSIGAGGGSIAYVDSGGLLRVGPQSAGADPGPACYDRGGEQPTVTDAALVLGMIPAAQIAGDVPLVHDLAERALARLAEPLGFDSVTEVACGVIRIVAAQMADAIRSVTIERGRDPREAALVAFGGAGPLFGTVLADELGVSTVVIPPYAGNFSAVGLLSADLARSASRTRVTRLSAEGLTEAGALAEQLFGELDSRGSRRVAAEHPRGAHGYPVCRSGAHPDHSRPGPWRSGRARAASRSPSASWTSTSGPSARSSTRSSRSFACAQLRRRRWSATPRRLQPTGIRATARARTDGAGVVVHRRRTDRVSRSSTALRSAVTPSSTGRRSCASRRRRPTSTAASGRRFIPAARS